MNQISSKEWALTKLVAKAGIWHGWRRAVQSAPKGKAKARAAGKYEESGKQLAEAFEEYEDAEQAEKAGKAGQP